MANRNFVVLVALIVALGGFLMGFDASVISGVNEFIEPHFRLSPFELGWAVASLTLTATLAMLAAGPLSDKYGRRFVLKIAAVLFAISAIASALAPTFLFLVIARMIGGLGVGASLIIAPLYIAEIAPPKMRGQMVSFNQLNIVIGISAAFFSNYLILQLSGADAPGWAQALNIGEHNWRWMLGLETLPAILYFFGLYAVPRSPRWLIMKGEEEEALRVMKRVAGEEKAQEVIAEVKSAISADEQKQKTPIAEIFKPAMRLVLTIGIVIAVLQQITGINSVFFYAPMIFKQSGIGQDAAFSQAILVGLVNLVFTVAAIALIDRLGRKPLLSFGVAGMAISMFVIAYGFNLATFSLDQKKMQQLSQRVNEGQITQMVNTQLDAQFESIRTQSGSALTAYLGSEGENVFVEKLLLRDTLHAMLKPLAKPSTDARTDLAALLFEKLDPRLVPILGGTFKDTEGFAYALRDSLGTRLKPIMGKTYENDVAFKEALITHLGKEVVKGNESDIIAVAMGPADQKDTISLLILFGILGFVASFAVSIGPVMWVLFSELFPQKVRAVTIAFVGMVNSAISFLVQLVFPWELSALGNVWTFALYGVFALLGLLFILFYIPETKGKSLEELERILVKEKSVGL